MEAVSEGFAMKKILSFIMVMALVTSTMLPTINVYASEMAPTYFGDPIEVNVYTDEYGNQVTERIYFIPDKIGSDISPQAASGNGWYKNEKEYTWSSGTGRYGYFFNKYAYVTYSFTAENAIGVKTDF